VRLPLRSLRGADMSALADRVIGLEHRVAELETRLAALAPDWQQAASSPMANAAMANAVTAPVVISARTVPTPAAATRLPTATEQPATPTPPVTTPPAPRARSRSIAELEEQLSSRLLAWVGGIALVLGAMFFLSLAFSRGWIGPEARVLIGLVAGAAALLSGAWLFERGNRTPATVLTGVGVGTGALALFAASRLYGFIPIEVALLAYLVVALGAVAIALRANSQAVAAFGLIATTLAPPVLGASPNLATVAFLGIALVGTALISFSRSWPWLAFLAFVFTAPQASRWFFSEPNTTLAVAGIGAFWAINALAAAGSALARIRPTVHRATASLLVLDASFAIGAIRLVLPDDPFARSVALLVLAGLQGALALPLVLRSPGRHPFGVLAAGLAAGVLAIGIALELGGIASPIGNTVLATAVAWVAIRFRERSAAAWAAAIGSLAIAHLVAFEYPGDFFGQGSAQGWPFTSPGGIVSVVVAAALLVVGLVAWRSFTVAPLGSRWRWTASQALAGGSLGAIAVMGYASGFEFMPDFMVVAWSILAVAAFGLAAFVRRDRQAWLSATTTAAVLIGMGAMEALTVVARPDRLLVDRHRTSDIVPLMNTGSLALAAVAIALGVAAWVLARWSPARPAGSRRDPLAAAAMAASGAVILYLVSIAIVDVFQARLTPFAPSSEIATQAQVALSITWVLVGAGAFAGGLVRGIGVARGFGLGLLGLATAKVFLFDLAALDVSYRVLSFLGLGGVLLASSFVAARFRSPGGASGALEEPVDDAATAAGADSTA
jgi:hypothetical protein